jgi:signal transduction histidine kinase/CheY-like chemotaxis protein
MRIRTRLRIAISTAIGAAVVVALTVALASQQTGVTMVRVRLYGDLVRQVSALNTLRGDYLGSPNERAYEQGQAALVALRALLGELEPLDARQQATIDDLRANAQDLGTYFEQLQAAAASADPRDPAVAALRERLDPLLAVKINTMFDEISGLAEASQAAVTASQQTTQTIAIIVALAVMAISVVVLALTSRRIDGSIRGLREGTALLSGDRLDRRVEVRGSDEIAELATAFNAMADRLEQDFAERGRLEEQLRHSQKMEAVGRLAGGVAHDFNNMLTAINGYAGILAASMDPDDPRLVDVEEIGKAGDRAAALTRQLLAFSRRQVLQPRVIDLNVVVSGIVPMLRRLVGEQIDLRTVLDPDLGHVRADPGQIEQVLLNLVVNARDAMPAGGALQIATANVEVPDDDVHPELHVTPHPHVQLAVTDDGVGMAAATVAHLFEPFFTTKPVGEGTGLGLATVYGIVTQSGGHITVESELGHGSTFRVRLPRVVTAVEPVTAVPPGPAPGGSEEVLVVDDEDVVRVFAVRVLGGLGYAVSAARSGDEAISLVAGHPRPFELLVTDVVLPGMNGRDLSDRLTAIQPSLRTLFISGYTQDAGVHRAVLDDRVAFLAKPFEPDTLGRAVRDLLDGAHPDRSAATAS